MVMSRAKRGESPALFYAGAIINLGLERDERARETTVVTNSYSLGLALDSYVNIRYN